MAAAGKLIIVGAGGHGKVACAVAEASGWTIAGFVDDAPGKIGCSVLGYPILGTTRSLCEQNHHADALLHIAVGGNRQRRLLATLLRDREFATLVHPSAILHSSVVVGRGTIICAQAVVHPSSTIGCHCIINTGAIVEHDCHVDDLAQVAPRAVLCGDVHIGEGANVFAGAIVTPGRQVGRWATVGAGAVALNDVLEGVTVAGVPASEISGGARGGSGGH